MKLEKSNNLMNLSSDSFEGAIPNVPPPIPAAHTPISGSKYNEYSKSVFTLVGLSSHSNLSRVMRCLRHLASFPGSRNELASINYDKIAYHKVQYLPPSYNSNIIFGLPPSYVSASTSKNAMDGMDKRFDGHTWCCTITSNIHNSQGFTLESPYVLASWFVTTRVVTSY